MSKPAFLIAHLAAWLCFAAASGVSADPNEPKALRDLFMNTPAQPQQPASVQGAQAYPNANGAASLPTVGQFQNAPLPQAPETNTQMVLPDAVPTNGYVVSPQTPEVQNFYTPPPPPADPELLLQTPPTEQDSVSADAAPFISELTFAQLGAKDGVNLKAGQNATGIDFTLPMGKVVTSARLDLDIEVSAAMAQRGSHLDLLLNGQPVGTILLNTSDSAEHYELSLPYEYFASGNTFLFRIADDEEFSCLIDYTKRYRVTVLPESKLTIEGFQIAVDADLSLFPMPFYDPFDVTKAKINFVMAAPESDTLSAAAVMASWFGIQAGYRGVKFTTRFNELPKGHAILFGRPGESIGPVLMPDHDCVRVMTHPKDPAYKLVLITGSSKKYLIAAVQALTDGSIAANTLELPISQKSIPPRQAYDAPKWIPTDRKVFLNELLRPDQSMISEGLWHEPLHLSFRAAPDLYQLYGRPIDLYLHYNFPMEQWIDEDASWLNVTLSGNYIDNLPVNKIGLVETLWRKAGGDGRLEERHLDIEPYMIYGNNDLGLYFDIKLQPDSPCSVLHDTNLKSQLNDDSYIDLSSTDHYARMPNLSYFVGATFPFTKFADFSQTVIMLPDVPSESEVQVMLDMCARAGDATGITVGYNTVMLGVPKTQGQVDYMKDKDVLVISNIHQTSFMSRLIDGSAFKMDGSELMIKEMSPLSMEGGLLKSAGRLLSGDWRPENLEAGRYLRSNVLWRGFISFLSPWDEQKIVVAVTANDDNQLNMLSDDLDNDIINTAVGGDVSIISGTDNIRSFNVGDKIYSGNVSFMFKLLHFAGTHVIWLAIMSFFMLIILGLVISIAMKNRAARRLLENQE